MCVLVVDAQPLIIRGITNVLSMSNITNDVIEAVSSPEAKRVLHQKNIKMLLIGLHPEYESGYELITYTRKNYPSTRVMVLSSSSNLSYFIKAKEMGVDGYLLKNADIDEFLYAFKVVFRGDRFFANQLLEQSVNGTELKELSELTEREKEVFHLLCKGLSNYEISKKLYISEATIKKHISNILSKLHLSNRVEVIFWANKVYGRQNLMLR